MPQTLPYATGAALFKEYKSRHGDKTLLGFSRGKDSITAAITMRDHLDVYPVFYYAIPGLPLIEETLDYYSRKLFGGRRIIQYPLAGFFKWLETGQLQTPTTMEVIKAAQFKPFSNATRYQWWADITEWIKEDEKLPAPTLCALGVRANDNPIRFLNVKNNGVIRPSAKNWLPCWNFGMADIIRTIEKAGVSLPPDYLLFGRSFGDGLDAKYLVPLKRHRPQDWEIILKWFPCADLVEWHYRRFIEGKTR